MLLHTEVLRKELLKGQDLREASKVFSDWTPNNLRRLVIGEQYIVLEYYVTGKLYPRRTKVIKQGKYGEGARFTDILKELIKHRVFSSVEEIVFACSAGGVAYNDVKSRDIVQLLSDKNLKTRTDRVDVLSSRFVRLRSISLTTQSAQEVAGLMNDCKEDESLYEVMLAQGYNPESLYAMEKPWYEGTYFRPTLYLMDEEGSALYKRITRQKERLQSKERKARLESIKVREQHLAKEKGKGLLKQILLLYSDLEKASKTLNTRYKEYNNYQKMSWGTEFEIKEFNKSVIKKLREVQLAGNLRTNTNINYKDLASNYGTYAGLEQLSAMLSYVKVVLQQVREGVPKQKEQRYLTDKEAIELLKRVMIIIFQRHYVRLYGAVAVFVLRTYIYNVDKYKYVTYVDGFDKLKLMDGLIEDIGSVMRSIEARPYVKEAFKILGINIVPVSELTLSDIRHGADVGLAMVLQLREPPYGTRFHLEDGTLTQNL